MEKIGLATTNQWMASRVFDVAREGIRVFSWERMLAVLNYIAAQHEKRIVIQRIKDRLNNPSAGGWSDILINLYFTDDVNKHICEIQIFHGLLFFQRQKMGGHEDYAIYRSIDELLEVIGEA